MTRRSPDRRRTWARALSSAVVVWALAWSSTSSANGTSRASSPELVVFAAASLKDVVTKLDTLFEAAHPGVRVIASFAGSQELRTQLEHGAAADVFVAADDQNMRPLIDQGLVESPRTFACNELALVVRLNLPAVVESLADLPRVERLVLGAPEVPVGRYAQEVFAKVGLELGAGYAPSVAAKVVSRELNVRQVLAKVALGEADAGIVYRTDGLVAGSKVRMVAIPPRWNVVATYPAARLRGARAPELAQAWLAWAASAAGQNLLRDAGFRSCREPPRERGPSAPPGR